MHLLKHILSTSDHVLVTMYPLEVCRFRVTCAYLGVRNVSLLENFVYVLNGWSIRDYICVMYKKMFFDATLFEDVRNYTNRNGT